MKNGKREKEKGEKGRKKIHLLDTHEHFKASLDRPYPSQSSELKQLSHPRIENRREEVPRSKAEERPEMSCAMKLLKHY